ncbi:hypothetical protein ACFE04_017897 [Oxalis oulophora]
MGDHFVLLMDRLLTESTLVDALERRNQSLLEATNDVAKISDSFHIVDGVDGGDLSTPRKLVECRICQDEDLDSNMETPCSCCGSLKYAHRACVQRWCNEKGNTTCEICNKQFKPGYTAPPPLFHLRNIPMHFRGNWQISRRELNNARLITLVPTTDHHFLDAPQEEHSVSTRNVICFRLILLIFTVLLILRHTLPFVLSGTYDYSLPLFLMLFVRTAGILIPIFFILKAITSVHRRRNQQIQNIEVIPVREVAAEPPKTQEVAISCGRF